MSLLSLQYPTLDRVKVMDGIMFNDYVVMFNFKAMAQWFKAINSTRKQKTEKYQRSARLFQITFVLWKNEFQGIFQL